MWAAAAALGIHATEGLRQRGWRSEWQQPGGDWLSNTQLCSRAPACHARLMPPQMHASLPSQAQPTLDPGARQLGLAPQDVGHAFKVARVLPAVDLEHRGQQLAEGQLD